MKGLKIKYKVNVPGLGIVENQVEGAYVGTKTNRQRLIGFAVELEGTAAGKYTVEYAAQLQGTKKMSTAKDGAWCGTGQKDRQDHSGYCYHRKREITFGEGAEKSFLFRRIFSAPPPNVIYRKNPGMSSSWEICLLRILLLEKSAQIP